MELLIDKNVDDVILEQCAFDCDGLIKDVILASLLCEGFPTNVEVSVSIVNDEEIREINKKFRKKDSVTDVLSFPLLDNFVELPNDETILLGDIIISLEQAIRQAEEYNHTLEREVGFLTAHSMLHLLGYDHVTEQEEKVMIQKQKNILNSLDLKRE